MVAWVFSVKENMAYWFMIYKHGQKSLALTLCQPQVATNEYKLWVSMK